jgi:Tol biopolymer transport system component
MGHLVSWPVLPAARACCTALLLACAGSAALGGEATWRASRSAQIEDSTQPVGATRPIAFEASRGTWMSVDVSPDGLWLAFDLLGHVYRLALAGGTAVTLTQDSGVALNHHPRISHNGQQIAFISDRAGYPALWVMNSDGTRPRLVAQDPHLRLSEPAWTTDDREIIVHGKRSDLELDAAGLLAYRVSDGRVRTLVAAAHGSEVFGAPSGDRQGWIYYHHARANPADYRNALMPDYRVMQVRRQGGTPRQVFAGDLSAIAPVPAPDGKSIAFARRLPGTLLTIEGRSYGPRTGLFVRDQARGEERLLLDGLEPDLASGGYANQKGRLLPGYAWLPDGSGLVVSSGGYLTLVKLDGSPSRRIDFIAPVQRLISQRVDTQRRLDDGPVASRFLRWPSPSARDGAWTFQAFGQIWRARADGSSAIALTTAPSGQPAWRAYAPAWSADGRRIAYASWSDGLGGHLWSMADDGSDARRLTDLATTYLAPFWRGDGRRIVALRAAEPPASREEPAGSPRWHIVELSAHGGEPARVLAEFDTPERELPRPRYGPAGRVYWAQQRVGGANSPRETVLVSVDPDRPQTPLEHWRTAHADDMALSPAGRRLAIERGGHAYVADLNRLRGRKLLRDEEFLRPKADAAVQRLPGAAGLHIHWANDDVLVVADAGELVRHDLRRRSAERIAPQVLATRDLPTGRLVLTGARLLTMAPGPDIAQGDITIERGRISCVGTCPHDPAATVLDMRGKTILPGLIDLHAGANYNNNAFTPLGDWQQRFQLAYGVTTNYHPSSWSQFVYPMAELLDAGLALGPRLFTAADKVRKGVGPWEYPLATAADADLLALRVARRGAVGIKEQQHEVARSRADLQRLAAAAQRHGLQLTGHLFMGQLEHALAMAMDGFTAAQHFPLHVPLYEDVVQFLGAAQFGFNPTLGIASSHYNGNHFLTQRDLWTDNRLARYWPEQRRYALLADTYVRPPTAYEFPLQALAMRDLIAAGSNVGIGTESEPDGLGAHWQIWMMSAGMPALDALRAATLNGARFLGLAHDLGSIEPGKLADLLVLDANPLEDIQNTRKIHAIVKAGVVFDPDLTVVWPTQHRWAAVP